MTYFSEVIADSPVAYWRFGEAAGATVALDSSPNGWHGTYVNAPSLGEAGALATDLDKAALFDGVNQRVTIAPPAAPGDSLSIEFWFKVQSGGDSTQCIIGEADGSPSVFWKDASKKLSVFYSAADHLNNTVLSYDTWHHVVIVVSSGGGTFYINGVADGVFASFPSGFAPDRIGDDAGGNTYKGWLDEVAWYPGAGGALTPARIQAHYAAAWRGFVSLRPRLRRDLHDDPLTSSGEPDTANYRWTDDELERHLLRAADELSEAWPEERKSTLVTTPGSRDLSIVTLDHLVRIEAVEYPVGRWPPEYVQFQTWGQALTLMVDGAPGGAEDVNVYWGRRHQIEKLTSTAPSEAEETLLLGASAYALLELAQYAINRINITGHGTEEDFKRQGEERLRQFRRQLRRFGDAGRVRTSSLYTAARAEPDQSTVTW